MAARHMNVSLAVASVIGAGFLAVVAMASRTDAIDAAGTDRTGLASPAPSRTVPAAPGRHKSAKSTFTKSGNFVVSPPSRRPVSSPRASMPTGEAAAQTTPVPKAADCGTWTVAGFPSRSAYCFADGFIVLGAQSNVWTAGYQVVVDVAQVSEVGRTAVAQHERLWDLDADRQPSKEYVDVFAERDVNGALLITVSRTGELASGADL